MDQLIPIHPNSEALSYDPSPEEKKCKIGKYTIRRIFEGGLDETDQEAIQAFVKNSGPFPDHWSDPNLLRFLQANNFKYDQTLQTMQQYDNWKKGLPIECDENVKQFLTSGVIYIQGRDHSYRPILILNAYKINMNEKPLDWYLKGLTYILEIVVNEMMVPGRIENWVIIMDLNYTGIVGLPINALKQVMGYLQNNYRSRLHKLYLLNTTMMLNITWNMAKLFLEEITLQKIQFVKGDLSLLFKSTNKEQLEEKFGGLFPNRTEYWPAMIHQKMR